MRSLQSGSHSLQGDFMCGPLNQGAPQPPNVQTAKRLPGPAQSQMQANPCLLRALLLRSVFCLQLPRCEQRNLWRCRRSEPPSGRPSPSQGRAAAEEGPAPGAAARRPRAAPAPPPPSPREARALESFGCRMAAEGAAAAAAGRGRSAAFSRVHVDGGQYCRSFLAAA